MGRAEGQRHESRAVLTDADLHLGKTRPQRPPRFLDGRRRLPFNRWALWDAVCEGPPVSGGPIFTGAPVRVVCRAT